MSCRGPTRAGRIVRLATLLVAVAAGSAAAQPGGTARLADGLQPPTRVFPGDRLELTVLDPRVFPPDGAWTIAGRTPRVEPLGADGRYRLHVVLPADFPADATTLPIRYADPEGGTRFDSTADGSDAVALADVVDPDVFLARRGRLSGATSAVTAGGRFCVCGLFPNALARGGLELAGAPLGAPLTATGTELWFEAPASLAPGTYDLVGDPAAGFDAGQRATIEIMPAGQGDAQCPCAQESGFLSDWPGPNVFAGPAGAPGQPPMRIAPIAFARRHAEPLIWLESLGGSTGEVFKAHLFNPSGGPIEIDGLFAVEPVDIAEEARDRILAGIRDLAGTHVDVTVDFYCLEFGAAAPPEGIVFRLAPKAAQEAFQPVARALAAARRLNEGGQLSPDTNPDTYFHSIRQWSTWTIEERFDRAGFLGAFLDHTKKNVEASGQAWTEEVEELVRRSAEGRWEDIAKVLQAAGELGGGNR